MNADIRRRTKLSHDPNNTNWSSSEGYGRRLLQSKGWTPGASLGARDKPYTKAKDTSYIRVSLKDDTLGLGAKSGVNLPPTGLDAFQGLLGRLNGKKDEELEKEQKTRDDLRRAVYTENRWGALRFVSGGFLVGDRIEEVGSDEPAAKVPSASCAPSKTDVSPVEPTKALPDPVTEEVNVKRSKRSKKRKQYETEDQRSDEAVNHQPPTFGHNPDIEERRSKEATDAQSKGFVESEERSKQRSEKVERKLARQVRREEKRQRRSELAMGKKDLGVAELEARDQASKADAAIYTASPTQQTSGRHNVRSRYVQQKKMALMNPKALNEVNGIPSMNPIYVQVV
ncbi:MAG: hypothetical protein Q9195_007120 [Heterodermia aff. obscurata]